LNLGQIVELWNFFVMAAWTGFPATEVACSTTALRTFLSAGIALDNIL